ncbi:MAG: hypothetical protein RSG52_08170 [Terrisporobacter sp.]|uniref:hypothetical protein n=1 Tax=Terrisporobacter sp. TaxID=1965305 RepID=UPI002FCC7275
MIGIFTSTASFAASAGWSGILPKNHGNIYTSTVTKSTSNTVVSAKATLLPPQGVNVWIQTGKDSGALRATNIAAVKTKNSYKLTYSGYSNSGRRVSAGIENRGTEILKSTKGNVDFK